MIFLEKHPFNHNIGWRTIRPDTTKLFLGTFPSWEVVNMQQPRMHFYYGSVDNRFWDLIREAFQANFDFTPSSISQFLRNECFGILDMVESCYRKSNRSSSDDEITIVEQLRFIDLLLTTNCRDFYTTSILATKLIKKQIKPLAIEYSEQNVGIAGFHYEILIFHLAGIADQFTIRIFTLYSPSPNGLRGIQNGINRQGRNIPATDFRLNQYQMLLHI